MKQGRFAGNCTVKFVDVARPTPGPGEVLVDITMSALCGSDLGPYRSPDPSDSPIGHEMIGRVAETTPGGTLRVGDRVAVYVLKGCGACPACLGGDIPFCTAFAGVILGGHGESLAVPEANCIPIPDDVPDDAAVVLGADTFGVAYHAHTRLGVQPHQWTLVAGVGPVGLGAVALFAHLGARVIAVDVNPYRLDLAKRLGAAEAVDAGDALGAVTDLTGGRGCLFALDCSPSDATLNLALDAAARGGRVALCGEKPTGTIKPSEQFIRKGLAAFGSWYFCPKEVAPLCELYRQGLPAERIITHRFPLAEAQAAHEQFAGGEAGKVVLTQD